MTYINNNLVKEQNLLICELMGLILKIKRKDWNK